ncbi:MAG: hypothetical protein GOV02_00535, partial [Candidatus Aenigmarchaeota archaeon]|nr:hypothetical protein [Candidatus Aenigmarchaeota archaeon]
MKYIKITALIVSVMVLAGCQTGGGTAVTVYDKSGNKVQETSRDAVALQSAYTVASECEKSRATIGENANFGVMNAVNLSKLSASAQTEYMRSLPILHMAGVLKSATSKETIGCQQAIVAYYNHLNVAKRENTSLWKKLIGIAGFVGGAYVIGNSVEGILQSAVGASGTSNTISGSRVTMDSGNNYSSPGGISSASSSGTGLGTNNLYPENVESSTIYGGNQPRGSTANGGQEASPIEFQSNSGDNA